MGDLIRELFQKSRSYNRKELLDGYKLEHSFLSQQIDERSHQTFMLGPFFVPVSFLIVAYTIIYNSIPQDLTLLINKTLLMAVAGTCYVGWLYFYSRARRLNVSSYPRIHSLEALIDITAHRYLRERAYKGYRIVRISPIRFWSVVGVLLAVTAIVHLLLVYQSLLSVHP